jgi:hypothetical protein
MPVVMPALCVNACTTPAPADVPSVNIEVQPDPPAVTQARASSRARHRCAVMFHRFRFVANA